MFSPVQVRRATDKVLASPLFAASERMCRFLRFVVERQLAGREAELKEYTIGVEVFDRDVRYDPRVDPIVRVEARRLRSKLSAYYAGEGKGDELIIELPKGTYVPVFLSRTAPRPEPRDERQVPSIAVLPFENASFDADTEYLSDGLTQQIIHQLTRVRGLRVVGWTTSARMRERRDIYEVGRELRAKTVLVGSVRSAGGRLRVSAQLVDVESSAYLWSEFYDRPPQDLLNVEEEISRSIVDALQVHLGLVRAATGSPEAYDLYFRARYYLNKRTVEGIRRATGLFRDALDIDPSFALAWAGLADAYILQMDYSLVHPADMIEPARSAAEQALRLSPCLGEAEISLAMIRGLYDWEWDDAERRFRCGMDLNPGYATGFHWFGVDYCALRGRFDEACAALNVALELEPLSCIIREGAGYVELLRGRHDRALAEYRKLLDFDPTFHKVWAAIGRAHIQMGRGEEALAALEKARAMLGSDHPAVLGACGQAHAMVGNETAARECLNHLRTLNETVHVRASAFAAVHVGLGEHRQAIEALRRGCDLRDASVPGIGVHPLYESLRPYPEFKALVDRVGCLRGTTLPAATADTASRPLSSGA